MSPFTPSSAELFFSRHDPHDPRLGDVVERCTHGDTRRLNLGKRDWVIAGYADDEGVRLSGGRPGAQAGPEAIRQALYKMTPFLGETARGRLLDFGDLQPDSIALAQRHQLALEKAQAVISSGARWMSFGGGHDYAYADGSAFLKAYHRKKVRPLILNFDAHLDVRPLDRGLSSGTPFFRLLSEFRNFDLGEIGIQAQCNSEAHLEWAKEHGARILTYEDLLQGRVSMVETLRRFLTPWIKKSRPVFLSIDIDGFASTYAMGCSQSFPTGFEPSPFLQSLRLITRLLDVRAVGIYEVSPPLDQDQRTAKLAALIAHSLLYAV